MRGKAGTILRVKQLTAADYDLVRKAEMERLYPDEPRLNLGYRGPHARALQEARTARFKLEVAEMQRCRCGLLLPCDDCLPTTAAAFIDRRMYRDATIITKRDM